MQALYIILGTLAVLIPGLFVISLFLPATVKVVRARVVPATVAAVFQQVNILRNWEGWSPWHQLDPALKLTYSEAECGVGAGFQWESKHRQVRNGQLTITECRLHEYIALDMQFMRQRIAKGYFRFEPARMGTLVTWGLRAELGQHPGRRLMGLMMDKWIGKDFERGLENLKRRCIRESSVNNL
ncbi:Polyketide cyclase / dehydrase and lipid transport [Chitinophaga sp. YR573]|uniref:SRPBCC family protein n=1 Tax=Chitinophaga sp. YR573 TaxID=1881040 RepID=UPI0008BE2930|nr:SRPBCC family protein [Chitinophaga sp. YR573]SEW36354.1 Polyketide cyclase / dehydrase and lipid transport [Chitinophaga sp. YR573]